MARFCLAVLTLFFIGTAQAQYPSRPIRLLVPNPPGGATDTLALFNPFGDDAIVDLTFLTAQGVEAPGQGQAIDVPRRSRVSVALQQPLPDPSLFNI